MTFFTLAPDFVKNTFCKKLKNAFCKNCFCRICFCKKGFFAKNPKWKKTFLQKMENSSKKISEKSFSGKSVKSHNPQPLLPGRPRLWAARSCVGRTGAPRGPARDLAAHRAGRPQIWPPTELGWPKSGGSGEMTVLGDPDWMRWRS